MLLDWLRSSRFYCLYVKFQATDSLTISQCYVSLSVISRPHFILFLISIYIASLLPFFSCLPATISFAFFDLVPLLKIFVPPLPYQFYYLVIECLLCLKHHFMFWVSHLGKIQILGNESFYYALHSDIRFGVCVSVCMLPAFRNIISANIVMC